MEDMRDEKEKENKDSVYSIGAGMAQSEAVRRYGEAASQIVQAQKGIRVDSSGQLLPHEGRNLNQISHYSKGNGNLQQQQKVAKSQAGFSAELLKEARENKEAILNGKSVRTRTTDGLGRTNDQKFDHLQVDAKGNIIPGSGSQMKFYGVDAKGRYQVIEKIVKDPNWEKYSDIPIDSPKEQYDGAVQYAKNQAAKYRNQAERMASEGKQDKAALLNQKAKKYENAAKQVRKSNVSTKEALEARNNPKLTVAKEVARDSHHAGVEAAKGNVVVCGAISMVQNLYAVSIGEKEMEDAAEDVLKTTLDAGGTAYCVANGGTALKSMMHASESSLVRSMGNTSFPQMLVLAVVETGKSMTKYISGDIDEEELLVELGEKGTGILASGYGFASGASAGAMIGSMVLPGVGTVIGTAVGGLVGSMAGSCVGSVLYRGAMEALQAERISEERRRVVENIAQKALEENKKYQTLILQSARTSSNMRGYQLNLLLQRLDNCMLEENVDAYVHTLEKVGEVFGYKLKFKSFDEFDAFMRDENAVLVL